MTSYLINTAASSFDLATTALLHKKHGNPDEFKNHIFNEEAEARGAWPAAVRGEIARRIAFGVLGLASFGGEKLYEAVAHQAAFPVHDVILLVPALIYAGAGLLNLIPLSFPKSKP